MVGQRMGAVDKGWKEISVKLVKLNTKKHEREERGDKQESTTRQASYTQTKRRGGSKGRKKSIYETPTLPPSPCPESMGLRLSPAAGPRRRACSSAPPREGPSVHPTSGAKKRWKKEKTGEKSYKGDLATNREN